MTVLLYLVFIFCHHSTALLVENSTELENYLCNSHQVNMPLELCPSINYSISTSGQSFCVSHATMSSAFQVKELTVWLKLHVQQVHEATQGFLFVNVNVTLERIVFKGKGCGFFNLLLLTYLNSQSFNYRSDHAAVLILLIAQLLP